MARYFPSPAGSTFSYLSALSSMRIYSTILFWIFSYYLFFIYVLFSRRFQGRGWVIGGYMVENIGNVAMTVNDHAFIGNLKMYRYIERYIT